MKEVTLGSGDRQSPSKTERTLTPPTKEAKNRTPTPPAEEANNRTPTPPVEEAKDHTPTLPTEEAENRTPSPPKERKVGVTQSEQPDETMRYPYPKYWDDPDTDAHVYAFL